MALSKEDQERIKKRWQNRNNEDSTTTSGGTSSGTSLLSDSDKSRIADRWSKRFDVDDTYINTFISDATSFLNKVQTDYKKLDWQSATAKSSESYYSSMRKTENDLSERAWKIQNYLNAHKDEIDEETYNGLSEYLNQFSRNQFSQQFYDAKDFYSQWETEEEYDFWDTHSTVENRQEWYSEQEDRLSKLKADRDAENSRWAEVDPIMMGAESVEYQTAAYEHTKRLDAINNEIAAIETEINNYKRGNYNAKGQYYGSKVVDDYFQYSQKSDFGAVSANREVDNPTREELTEYDARNDSSTWYYDENGVLRDAYGDKVEKDASGKWVNPKAQGYAVKDRLGIYLNATEKDIEEYMGTIVSGTWGNIIGEGIDGSWDQLTENEIAIYYYLLNSSGQETADKYLSDMKTELNRRSTTAYNKNLAASYDDASLLEKIALNAASVPAQLFSGIAGTAENMSLTLRGEDINPYSAAHSGSHFRNTVLSKTAEEFDSTGLKIPVLDFTLGDAYQAGMSILDSYAAIGIGGQLGVVLLASSAANSEATRLYEQGASKEQIALGSAAAGAAEMVFESLSIEKLINMKDAKTIGQAVKNALIQGGIEASEEGFTEIANIITNSLIMGNQSDWAKLVDENGGNTWQAFLSKVRDVANAALGGFISGAGSAGGPSLAYATANYAQQQDQYADTGKTIREADGGVDALIKLANEVAGVSDAKMQKSLIKQSGNVTSEKATGNNLVGKAVAAIKNRSNDVKVGRLYNTVESANNQANASANQADIAKSLQRKGFNTETATDIAEALVASYNGNELTEAQTKLLEYAKDNKVVQEAISNIVTNTRSTMGQRSQKIRDFQEDVKVGTIAKRTGTSKEMVKELLKVADKGGFTADVEDASDIHYEVSVDGKMVNTETGEAIEPQGLVQAEDGTYMIATKDAEPVSSSKVSYESVDQALVYETLVNLESRYGKTSRVIADMDLDSRNELLALYNPQVNKDGGRFVNGILDAYFYGHRSVDLSAAGKDSTMWELTEQQRKIAWNTGRAAGIKADTKVQSNVDTVYAEAEKILESGKTNKGGYHAVLEEGISPTELNGKQKAVYRYADDIAQGVQANIRVYSGKNKAKGFYNHATDEIWLNLNAADTGREAIMAFTLSHELVHRGKKGSPAKYQAFVDFLMKEYGKQGADVEAMIAEQIQAAEEFNKTVPESQRVNMTREKALEEVVCDACQRMLLDTNAGQKLAEFGAQSKENKSFLEDLKRWITELLDKLRNYFRNAEPDSLAAKAFNKFDANVKQILADMYVDMSIDAGEKLSTIKAAYGEQFADKFFGVKDIRYNLAAVDSHKAKMQKEYSEDSSTDLKTIMARYDKIIDIWTRLGGELNSKFLAEWNSKVGKDRSFTIFKAQAGYKYNVELSSMCKKGVPLFEAIDTIVKQEVMKELGTDVLGKAEKEILYDILKQHHFEIPCAICYVEQARQREGVIIDAFLNGKVEKNAKGETTKVKLGWNQVLDSIQKEMKANGVDYTFAQVSRDIATDKYSPAVLKMDEKTTDAFYASLKKIANQEISRYNKAEGKSRKLLTDVTPAAVKECFKGTLPSNLKIFKVLFNESKSRFKIQNDLLYSSLTTQNLSMAHNELYGLFNSQGGVSGYKTKQGTTIYWGDILGKSWKPDTLRNEGGVRNQSNSDFQMYTLLDQAQMYLDFTAKGYYLQAYTKVLSELKLFGLSRGKINASLIPKVVVYYNADGYVDIEKTMATAGLDENGNPIYDDIEGINHDEAFMLIEDPEYSKSICGICIGYSDAHIRKLLDDNRVQQIIGFHDKTDDGTKRYKGARYAKNYNGLNEAVNKEGKTVHIGFNPYVKKAEKKFKLSAETETFEGTVNYNGKTYTADDIPRLAADLYLEMCAKKEYEPAYKDFAKHRNYYKLLADFGLYDSQGHYAPHRKVVYNMPDTVPYLDANGKKQTMKTYDYIKAELEKELAVRDSISEALADTSSEGIIPQFKAAVKKSQEEKSFSLPKGGQPRTMATLDIDRVYVKYGDVAGETKALDATVGSLKARGKIVQIENEDLSDIVGKTDWNDRSAAREYTRGILKKVLGVPVYFTHNGKTAEVVLTQNGRNHALAGMNTPEKAAAFERFGDLVANAEYAYSSLDDKHSNEGQKVQHEISWDCFATVVDVGGTQISVIFKIRTIDGELRSQIYSLATRNETGSSHNGGQQKNKLNALSNYGGTPVSDGTVSQPSSDVKNNIEKPTDNKYIKMVEDGVTHIGEYDVVPKNKEPKKTILAWKALTVKPAAKNNPKNKAYGNMYPPQVHQVASTPYGVWLYANEAPKKLDKDGNPVLTKYGRPKVKEGMTYRPAWHFGDAPYASQFRSTHGFFDDNGVKRFYMSESKGILVWALCEMAADENYQDEADMAGHIGENRYWDEQQASLWYLPENGYYKYMTNRVDPNSVTWYLSDKMRIVQTITDAEMREILTWIKEDGSTDLEFNYPLRIDGKDVDPADYGIPVGNVVGDGIDYVDRWKNQFREIALNGEIDITQSHFYYVPSTATNYGSYETVSFSKEVDDHSQELIKTKKDAKILFVNPASKSALIQSFEAATGVKVKEAKTVAGRKKIIEAAKNEGYDIVEFAKETNGLGSDVVIVNPDSVIRNYKFNNVSERYGREDAVSYKLPIGEDTSPRALLANAFEGIITNDIEKQKIQEYKGKVEMLNAEEQKLHELRAQIKELSFAKGKRDTKKIKELQFDATHTENRIATLDKVLLRLEAATPLQNILKREKEMAYKRAEQKGKEALKAYREAEAERDKQWHSQVKDKYQASKKKAIETREKRDAREKLQKLVLDTVKWITYPTKTDVKCPDILKQPYADFLNGIDLSSKRLANGGDPTKNDLRLSNAMGSLATALEKIMTSQDPAQDTDKVLDTGYLDLPANFVQKLRDMTENVKAMMTDGDYVVNNMSAAEVRQLSQMIRTLNHAIKEVSTLYANLRFANVEALGDSTMSFMDDLGEIEKTGGVKDFVQWDNALPYYAFKRFGEGGESIFDGLMDAQDKLAFLAQKIFDFQEKAWTGKEAKEWSKDTHEIDLPNGNKLTLTTADAMSIYCLSRREQGLQHLLGGGTRVIGLKKGSQKAKDSRSLLTIKDIEAINESLTDRQRAVAEAIQEFMSTVCSDWGNEISMKRFLTKEFTEKFYFPIESNDENLSTKDPSAQQSDLFRLLNISATKPLTPGANNEVIIRNIFDVFTGHASDMARLNAYGMALLDYMKWLNYREKAVNEEGQIKVRGVRKSMEKAYGNAAKSYVLNLIKDVNGRPSDGGDPTILMKWMRTAKTASVGSSLRVATLQITSYPRAALVLSPKSLALGLSKLPQINKAKKYCGIALWKSFGFYDTNIARSIEDQMKGVKDVKQKLIELSLKGAEWGDAITWGCLWNACEYEVAQTTKNKVGSEEFYQEVGKKLREVVYRTQVVDSTLTRSQIMRSKRGMAQEAAAFMSEPTLSANILMDAGFQFSAEKRRTGSAKAAWAKTGKYISKAVAVYSIGQLTAALLEGLWDAWRDDDDEEFSVKFLNAFVENLALDLVPFNKIPIVSDIFEAALAMFDIGYYSSDKMSTTWLTQAVSAADAWKEVLGEESSMTAYNALYKTTRAISSFLGVSFSGVMREAVALWNNTGGAYDITWKIRTWDLSKTELAGEALDAFLEGNDRQVDSIRAEFPDDDSYQSAMRTAIKNRYTAGEIDYDTAIQYLVEYGGMEEDAAYWKAEEWKYEADTDDDFSKYSEFFTAVETGKNLKAVIKKYTENGVKIETLASQITEHFKPIYTEMTVSDRASIKGYLLNAYEQCGVDREDATKKLQYWDFLSEHPDSDLSQSQIADYYEFAKPAGVSADLYSEYCEKVKGITGEGKKERRMAVINSLPITSAQKDALYYAEGWTESKLYEAPWH